MRHQFGGAPHRRQGPRTRRRPHLSTRRLLRCRRRAPTAAATRLHGAAARPVSPATARVAAAGAAAKKGNGTAAAANQVCHGAVRRWPAAAAHHHHRGSPPLLTHLALLLIVRGGPSTGPVALGCRSGELPPRRPSLQSPFSRSASGGVPGGTALPVARPARQHLLVIVGGGRCGRQHGSGTLTPNTNDNGGRSRGGGGGSRRRRFVGGRRGRHRVGRGC